MEKGSKKSVKMIPDMSGAEFKYIRRGAKLRQKDFYRPENGQKIGEGVIKRQEKKPVIDIYYVEILQAQLSEALFNTLREKWLTSDEKKEFEKGVVDEVNQDIKSKKPIKKRRYWIA